MNDITDHQIAREDDGVGLMCKHIHKALHHSAIEILSCPALVDQFKTNIPTAS